MPTQKHPITTIFEEFNLLTPHQIEHLAAFFIPQVFQKKSLIINLGDINDKLYYVEFGLLREFSYISQDQDQDQDQDQTHTHWLMSAGHFVYLAESFLEETPSMILLEALDKTKVWYITKKDLLQIRLEYPIFNFVGQTLTEQYLLKYERFINMLRLKPIERYEWFEQYHSDIINTAPLKYIASYLQMHPTTLSDIRSQRAKQKK